MLTGFHIDKQNFVRRNRIVAGLCDATILVESAEKGGGLITARIAQDYGRAVFAFPGAVGAPYSEGCNHLIRDNGASLLTSATDLVAAMGWHTDAQLQQARRDGPLPQPVKPPAMELRRFFPYQPQLFIRAAHNRIPSFPARHAVPFSPVPSDYRPASGSSP